MTRPLVVALLGAESTGKTTLADQLATALRAPGRTLAVVPEYLREFCDLHGRTPRREEQSHIADEQTRRIDAAAWSHDIVIADTTALMIAVYSHHVFGDTGLYVQAKVAHAKCHVTLLTGLDLPWQSDGIQRDELQVRVPVNALVRNALGHANLPYSVVFGSGHDRLASALACVEHALRAPAHPQAAARWMAVCERCGDAACERHGLARD
jgi:nicotinamide riboside kinase